jgi:aryl-alcohol dehydrogenase-like predicted oxidoreductase
VLCRGLGLQVPGLNTVDPWIRYALSHEVSTVVIGCDDPQQVEQNVAAASLEAMPAGEMSGMEKTVELYARNLMYYK